MGLGLGLGLGFGFGFGLGRVGVKEVSHLDAADRARVEAREGDGPAVGVAAR